MSKPTSIVDINGQRYDAITGQLAGAMKKAAAKVKKPGVGFNLDGFTKSTTKSQPRTKRSIINIQRKPEHSKTLMRAVVKKPSNKTRKNDSLVNQGLTPNYARALRAKITPKNDKVRKFGLLSSKEHFNIGGQGRARKDVEVIPRKISAKTKVSTVTIISPTAVSQSEMSSHQQLERLLDYALHRADAHKQAQKHLAKKPWHRVKVLPRWLSVIVIVALFGGIGGLVVWKTVPAVPLKVAASRAHIDATLPSYTPTGYNYSGHIEVKEGTVTIPYKDSTNGAKSYTVTQKASNMDSSSLASTVLPRNTPTQTLDSSGRAPVFGYTDNQSSVATCVSGGVQTIVSGDIDTNSAQKVASSLCQ